MIIYFSLYKSDDSQFPPTVPWDTLSSQETSSSSRTTVSYYICQHPEKPGQSWTQKQTYVRWISIINGSI